jgi:hypothetical protein
MAVTASPKPTQQVPVHQALEENRVAAVRVRKRLDELGDERRQLGSRKGGGLIGDAVSKISDVLAAGVRDGTTADPKAERAEVAKLEARLDAIGGEAAACQRVAAELTDARAAILQDPERHAELTALARTVADEGVERLRTAKAAARDAQESRRRVIEAVSLASAGVPGDVDDRRRFAAQFAPFIVARNSGGQAESGAAERWKHIDAIAQQPVTQVVQQRHSA